MLKSLMKEEEFSFFLRDNQDKLVVVKFFTTWCFPCRELQKNIAVLLTEKKNLAVLEVDAEKFPQLAQSPEFNIRSVPTVFLFWKGRLIRKGSGNMNVQQLREFIST